MANNMSPFYGVFLDKDGNEHDLWETVSGSGAASIPGAVVDYNALINKPQIDGVTLAGGNNTPEGLKLSYTHIQDTPAAVWYIAHALNSPSATVYSVNTAGEQIVGEIDTALRTANLTVLRFSQPLAGIAYIKY